MTTRLLLLALCTTTAHAAGSSSPRPRPRPRPSPSPSPRPVAAPTPSPSMMPTTQEEYDQETYCRNTIANTSTETLLKANYTSMEDAFDHDTWGHANYACAKLLLEEYEQYDKAEPYLWCVFDHCAECDGTAASCQTRSVGLYTESECNSATWNYLGFATRSKSEPEYGRAKIYYTEALSLWPENCGAMAYLTELYLTVGNATMAQETYDRFCEDGCDAADAEEAAAALGACPTPDPTLGPTDAADAASRRASVAAAAATVVAGAATALATAAIFL